MVLMSDSQACCVFASTETLLLGAESASGVGENPAARMITQNFTRRFRKFARLFLQIWNVNGGE